MEFNSFDLEKNILKGNFCTRCGGEERRQREDRRPK
jgi:hypothetical protein